MSVKQVIVVRRFYPDEKGNLKKVQHGKLGAQIAHAAMAFLTRRLQKQLEAERGKIVYIDKIDPLNPERIVKVPAPTLGVRDAKKIKDLFSAAELEWMVEIPGEKNFKKVLCRVDTEDELKEIYERAKAAGLEAHLIIDSGATEFHGVPTATTVGIGPDYDERIDPITGKLELY